MNAIGICIPRRLVKTLLVAALLLAPIVQHERASGTATAAATPAAHVATR